MRRVNEALREVLSAQLAEGLKDPRIGFVTVTGVDTSPDLHHARVYVSILGDPEARDQALEGLRSSRGFLQARVGEELRMKRTPRLAFVHDDTVQRAAHLTELIDRSAPTEGDA